MLKRNILSSIKPRLLGFMFILLIWSVAASMDEPIFSRFVESLTSDPAIIGILIALTSISYMIASIPVGWFVSKIGTRYAILLGIVAEVVSLFLFWFSTDVSLYIVAAIVTGIGAAVTWAAARVFVADFSTNKTRGKAFGLYSTSWGIGWAVGPLIGGAVALSNMKLPFLVAGLVMIVTLPFFFTIIPKADGKRSVDDKSAFLDGLRFLRNSNKMIRYLLLAYAAMYMIWSITWIFAPLLFEQFSNFEIGMIFFCNSLAYALGAIVAGVLADRYNNRLLLTFGFLSTAACVFLFSMSTNFLIALILSISFGVTLSFTQPILDARLNTSLKKQDSGIGNGLVLTVTEFGIIISSILGGLLASIGGFIMPFWFAALVCFLIGGMFIFAKVKI